LREGIKFFMGFGLALVKQVRQVTVVQLAKATEVLWLEAMHSVARRPVVEKQPAPAKREQWASAVP
jgi:hypothetical protein